MTAENDKIYKLIGTDGKPHQSRSKGTLGGHRKDKIYGALDYKGALARQRSLRQFSPINKRQSLPDTDLVTNVCARNTKNGKGDTMEVFRFMLINKSKR